MSQLSDVGIRKAIEAGDIKMDPFDPSMIQPASIDVRLGERFRTERGLEFVVPAGCCEDMVPGQFILGHTMECIALPADLAARVEGKSTIGRLGLAIHVTAGFVDPGFQGQLTLELKNLSAMRHIQLRPGMPIAQISFHRLETPALRPYGHPELGSHYQGQMGPRGSIGLDRTW